MIAISHVGIRTVFFSGLWLFVIIAFFHVFYREDLASNSGQTDSLLDTKTTIMVTPSQQQFKDVKVRVHREFIIDPDERFLAYFAHSGFHNQRVALANAMLLAKILNRTLLMPPILFGPPIPWVRFDKLYEKLLVSTKMGLEHCWKIPDQIPLPAECLNYFSSTTVSWDFLFDMEPIREWHKIIDRWEPSYGWLSQNLRVSLDEDFHFIKDTTLFDYRIHDSSFASPQNVKYKRRLDIKKLEEIDKKVLHLGSLFGLHRVTVEKPDS
ncbi:545_t:CDS:1, partial [Acaulospora morrowiae]